MSEAPDKIYYGVLDNGFQCVNTVQTSTTPDAYIRKDALLEWAKEIAENASWVSIDAVVNKIESL